MPDRKRFINVRGGYSDTSGIAPCNTEMQLYQFDKRTRMMISNKTFDILKNVIYSAFNSIFEAEYVGYRFVDGQIIAITDEQEIGEIEEACCNPYKGCRSHLKIKLADLLRGNIQLI